MKRRTKSFDCLYFESSKLGRKDNRLTRCTSLANVHLNVNSSWFTKNKLTRSKSLDNHVNNVNSQPTHHPHLLMNSNLINTKLIDDHNLPATISDDLFDALMRFEKNRSRTFKNWPISHITPAELSKAGFYYLLDSDLVRCFECKITLFNWEPNDKAIIEHYQNNPKCGLLNGYDVGNVPIDRTPHAMLRELVDFEEFRPVQSSGQVISGFDDLQDDYEGSETLDEQVMRFSCEKKTIESSQEEDEFTEEELFEYMKSEAKRLETFEKWPEHLVDKVRPVDLAQCGFFHTLIRDRVICAFCRTPAWDWATTDVPINEHYLHNPDCPLLNDEECGNQPIKHVNFKELLLQYSDIPPIISSSYSNEEIGFSFDNSNSDHQSDRPASFNQESFEHLNEPIDLNELSLDQLKDFANAVSSHKHVEKYYTYKNRLDTFNEWPNKNVNKNRLADAGFYYLGIKDQVKCISCDLVMSDWSAVDDPWIEHCKYKSNCEFLKLNKGTNFITRNSKLKNSPKIEVTSSGSTASSASSSSSSDIENENSINYEEDAKTACKICMANKADIVYLPCLHLASCASCTIAIKDCPLCKSKIKTTMKIYIG